jgi:hypothetical protein
MACLDGEDNCLPIFAVQFINQGRFEMKKVILASVLLTGCATQSGVIPEGKDSYLLLMSGGISSAPIDLKIKAHKEANAYCMGFNKRPETIAEKTSQSGMTSDVADEELKFRCIANSDVPDVPADAH